LLSLATVFGCIKLSQVTIVFAAAFTSTAPCDGEHLLMANGTVKWFNTTKGFGFIMPQGGGPDVFVHITAVQAAGLRGLNDGQEVSYEVVMERGKAAATNLKLA